MNNIDCVACVAQMVELMNELSNEWLCNKRLYLTSNSCANLAL